MFSPASYSVTVTRVVTTRESAQRQAQGCLNSTLGKKAHVAPRGRREKRSREGEPAPEGAAPVTPPPPEKKAASTRRGDQLHKRGKQTASAADWTVARLQLSSASPDYSAHRGPGHAAGGTASQGYPQKEGSPPSALYSVAQSGSQKLSAH